MISLKTEAPWLSPLDLTECMQRTLCLKTRVRRQLHLAPITRPSTRADTAHCAGEDTATTVATVRGVN